MVLNSLNDWQETTDYNGTVTLENIVSDETEMKRGLVFAAIDFDKEEEIEEVRQLLKQTRLTFVFLLKNRGIFKQKKKVEELQKEAKESVLYCITLPFQPGDIWEFFECEKKGLAQNAWYEIDADDLPPELILELETEGDLDE